MELENILSEQEVDTLFEDPNEGNDTNTNSVAASSEEKHDGEPNSDTEETTEVENPDDLFDDEDTEGADAPESVGSDEKDKDGEKDATSDKDDGASPNENFYSSIASALVEDGVFPNLNDEDLKGADDAEGFSNLINKEVEARLNDSQKRILKALDNGVEPSTVKMYENTLSYINGISDNQISEESEQGEQIRRQLIFQDFLNKGYSKEKAQKFTQRSIDSGNDIDDAKEALQSNREFFQNAYNETLRSAEADAEKEKAKRKEQSDAMANSIMKDKKLMGDMTVSDNVRRKAMDNILKPTYRDTETGEYMTALQKYQREHPADFMKYVGLMYTITDGFSDFTSFAKGEAKKEMKKGLAELEKKLSRRSGSGDGSMSYQGFGRRDDSRRDGDWSIAF